MPRLTLRDVVLTWTLLTTTFSWTSSMRMLMKPEISSWQIFAVGGEGASGQFWLPPLVAVVALLAFYVEGRGRYRPLFHTWLIAWHAGLTALAVLGSVHADTEISFGTWGIHFAVGWLAAPFAVFLCLAVVMVAREVRGGVPVYPWHAINWRVLGVATLLFVPAFVLFRVGEGFDGFVKLAVATAILQWVLFVEALGRPRRREPPADAG